MSPARENIHVAQMETKDGKETTYREASGNYERKDGFQKISIGSPIHSRVAPERATPGRPQTLAPLPPPALSLPRRCHRQPPAGQRRRRSVQPPLLYSFPVLSRDSADPTATLWRGDLAPEDLRLWLDAEPGHQRKLQSCWCFLVVPCGSRGSRSDELDFAAISLLVCGVLAPIFDASSWSRGCSSGLLLRSVVMEYASNHPGCHGVFGLAGGGRGLGISEQLPCAVAGSAGYVWVGPCPMGGGRGWHLRHLGRRPCTVGLVVTLRRVPLCVMLVWPH
jgi:hypothetical protein